MRILNGEDLGGLPHHQTHLITFLDLVEDMFVGAGGRLGSMGCNSAEEADDGHTEDTALDSPHAVPSFLSRYIRPVAA
jgi:hypothetical protein